MNTPTGDDYLKLPYTIEVIRDESDDQPGYVARVIELPGCLTQADDFEELAEMVEDAMRLWIETALEDGKGIPQPRLAAQQPAPAWEYPLAATHYLQVAESKDGAS
jgi:antitoxin HicB